MLGRRALPTLSKALKNLTRPASTPSASPAAVKANDQIIAAKKDAPVTQQAPNYPTTWSTSQRPRPIFGSEPRFEQTNMALQPNPLSAMELIAQEPIRLVHGRKAICDGGGGPLGHPKIYINLDQPGPRACGCVYVSRHLGFWIEVAQYMPTRAPFAIDIVEFGSNKTPIIINSHPHMLPYETIERASPSDKCYDLNVKNTADHKIGFNPF